MPGELGQTTDPKGLIPGEPEQIAADLRAVVDKIERMHGTSRALGEVDVRNWTGNASTMFHTVFGAEPPKWTKAAESLGHGAEALANYGDVLTWGQGEAQRAIELYTQAQAASRSAAAAHDTRVAFGMPVGPFTDPGAPAANEAQAVLDNARAKVDRAGSDVVGALGRAPDNTHGLKNRPGDKSVGTDRRTTQRRWDPKKKQWVDEDPGGWQKNKGGRSHRREAGSQSDGLLTDELGDMLDKLGVDVPQASASAGAHVEALGGSVEGGFQAGSLFGDGTVDGSLLGAGAQAHAGASPLGATAGASAEAYLGKGSLDGEVGLGKHAEVSGHADGLLGAEGNVDGTIGPLGGQAGGDVFAGGEVTASGGAEVGGVSAGAHASGQVGVGAGASAQFGMGDDGKFHVGGSISAALGFGGSFGFDVSVDPGEVASTLGDAGKATWHAAEDFGDSLSHGFGLW